MKVLVTGVFGFLGTNMVHECLARKHTVRAFSLPGPGVTYIEKKDVEIVYGDMADSGAGAVRIRPECSVSGWNKIY